MAKPFSETEREQIKNLILEKSKELFVLYGFEKVTVSDITKATNVGKGTFYQFYKSKGELFVDIYSKEWCRLQEELILKYKGCAGDITETVLAYIRDNRKNLLSTPILSMIHERDTLKYVSDRYGAQGLKDFSKLNESVLRELIHSWSESSGCELTLEVRVLAAMMRSLNYLNYHKDEIGEDIFNDVISTFMDAIALEIRQNIIPKKN